MNSKIPVLAAIVLLFCLGPCGTGTARAQATEERPDIPTAEQIESRLAGVDSLTGVDDATRAAIKEDYEKAQRQLREAARLKALIAEFDQKSAEAP